MRKRYLFFDIDGMLKAGGYENGYIPDSAKHALRILGEKGHFLALATGRSNAMARPVMEELGFVNMVSDGGYGITIDEFKTIWAIYKRHIEAGECFSHAGAPHVYQSPAVLEKRRKYEEDQRRMAEMRKNAKPATPEEIEQLLKEFPDEAYDIRRMAEKGFTAAQIRFTEAFNW